MKKRWLAIVDEHGFQGYKGELFDVCERKHGGNPESVEAFRSIKDRLSKAEERVLNVIRNSHDGLTVNEIADLLYTTPNAISGRCSTLRHIKHKIEKVGTRLTRSGNPAAILKAL